MHFSYSKPTAIWLAVGFLSSAIAAPVIHEPFAYPNGSIAGTNGGGSANPGTDGWNGAWAGTGQVNNGGLLTTTSAWANRPFLTIFSGSSSVPLYFSARFTKTGGATAYALWLQFSDVATTNARAADIGLADGKFSLRLRPPTGGESNGDFGSYPVGEEVFIVGRLEFNVNATANERLTVWVNPSAPHTASQTQTITGGDLGWVRPSHVQAGNWVLTGGEGRIDDIRVGATWDDVIDPPVIPPKLRITGFDPNGSARFTATDLNPAVIYDLTRGTDLTSFPDLIGAQATGATEAAFTDPEPPSQRAFYRLAVAGGIRMPVLGVQPDPDGATLQMSAGSLKLQVFSPRVVRVVYSKTGQVPTGSLAVTATPATSGWTLDQTATHVRLTTTAIQVRVNRASGAVSFHDTADGHELLAEPSSGGKSLQTATAAGFDTLRSRQTFALAAGEAFLGLGQHMDGVMNRRGGTLRLQQKNPGESAVPVLLSSRGYGILWDNPAVTDVDLGSSGGSLMSWTSEASSAIDYYFMAGPSPDTVVGGYRILTGRPPLFGRWAWGFWQSKERYQTQQELLDIVNQYRSSGIPIDGIIQDWQYWPGLNQTTAAGGWGSHEFNASRYPNPTALMDDLHARNVRMLISVWPKFDVTSSGTAIANAQALAAVDGLLPGTIAHWSGPSKFVDPFRTAGRQVFWDQLSEKLFAKGLDGWWLDGAEPELADWDQLRALQTAAGPGVTVANAFPLMHTTAVYQGQRAESPAKRPIILTRSAYAGQQRNAAITWNGDVQGNWGDFAKSIPAGLNFCASGIPYWNSDIGGFFSGNPGSASYAELFTRWFQFGAFCPMFRVHGTNYPKEIWRFPAATQTILTDFDRLRYHLLPYIYSVSWMVTDQDYTMMRPLAMDFPTDATAWNTADQFMFGPALMVCPVITAGATSRNVYLPAGSGWHDFWTGQVFAGGQTITASAPIERMPLWVRAGSVLPIGPAIQYAAESVDPMEIRIYQGADGSFTLYEDAGDNHDYQSGSHATIPLQWHEASRTLTIGARQGSFPGMQDSRQFRIVWVRPGQGVGNGQSTSPDTVVAYDGDEIQVLDD